MILENALLRLTLDLAHGAAITGLFDKTSGLDCADAPTSSSGPTDIHAAFHTRDFSIVASTPGISVTLAATSADGTLKQTKTFALIPGKRSLQLAFTLENLTARERDILWGEHLAFGAPFVNASCEIAAPIVSYFDPKEEPVLRMRWPHLVDGTDISRTRVTQPNDIRTYFLNDFAAGTCGITNADKKLSLTLGWDTGVFSYCWLTEALNRITLAPYTGMPNALEEGHGTLTLPANGSVATSLSISIATL
ncbi:MAG: hypothetical protein WCT04_16210 [Planctomycetota bacterium]